MPNFLQKLFGGGKKKGGGGGDTGSTGLDDQNLMGNQAMMGGLGDLGTTQIRDPMSGQMVTYDNGFNAFGGGQIMTEAVKNLTPTKVLTDKDEKRSSRKRGAMDSGTMSEVTKVKFKRSLDGTKKGNREGFFKKDKGEVADHSKGPIDKQDPRLAARAVASSRLDQALGTNVLSKEHFAKRGGVDGMVSEKVGGVAMSNALWSAYDDGDQTYFNKRPEDRQRELDNGARDIDGKLHRQSGASFVDQSLNNSKTMKGLADLQVMDYLTGQKDRHFGNVFIDKDGSVKGIDNDMAFHGSGEGGNFLKGHEFEELPKFIDKGTGQKILDMDENSFVDSIKGQRGDLSALNDDEIDQAKQRFYAMKEHVLFLDLTDGLVENWDQSVYDQMTQDTDNKGPGNNFVAKFNALSEQAVKHRGA